MPRTPNDQGLTPDERRKARDEYLDISQGKEIAEGDITVSETVNGEEPQPNLDDHEVQGEDALIVLDEDNPELNMDTEKGEQ